jgi:hypothetical protein
MAVNKTLTYLDLSYNGLGTEGECLCMCVFVCVCVWDVCVGVCVCLCVCLYACVYWCVSSETSRVPFASKILEFLVYAKLQFSTKSVGWQLKKCSCVYVCVSVCVCVSACVRDVCVCLILTLSLCVCVCVCVCVFSGGEALGDAILENKSLRTLLLASNGFKSRACFVLCVSVIENLALQRMSLDSNPIGIAGSQALMNVPMNTGVCMCVCVCLLVVCIWECI